MCKFGARCANPNCTFVHVRTKGGKPLSALGIDGDTAVDTIPKECLSWSSDMRLKVVHENVMI